MSSALTEVQMTVQSKLESVAPTLGGIGSVEAGFVPNPSKRRNPIGCTVF
jgi:hypothetical protein